MTEDEVDFEESYNKIRLRYTLPEFNRICEDFDIEKVSEKESKFLLREIRRVINEKISAYLHLFETLLNPANPPIFVFSILREMSESDKNKVKELYKQLSRVEIKVMKLDSLYNEKAEAEFVLSVYNMWQKMKLEVNKLVSNFEVNFEKDTSNKNNNYFD